MKKKDILDFESRRTIYNTILNNPGIHLRELSRKIKIPLTALKYHIVFFTKK